MSASPDGASDAGSLWPTTQASQVVMRMLARLRQRRQRDRAAASEVPRMRTGLLESSEEQGEDREDVLEGLVVLLLILVSEATDVAATLAEHAEAEVVGKRHVRAALKSLIFRGAFFDSPDLEARFDAEVDRDTSSESEAESEEEAEEEDGAEKTGSDAEAESEAESETESEADEESEAELEADGACLCEVCVAARVACREWDAWEPEDEIEAWLKEHTGLAVAPQPSFFYNSV